MSNVLIMDDSKQIFKLDKEILLFKIKPSSLNKSSALPFAKSGQMRQRSEENLTITNLTSNYLAFRVKTTKKDNYSVNPTYCILFPNENKLISFIFYYNLDSKLDSKGHKFKFEGFTIPESRKNENVKDLFNEYINKGIKVVGNTHKIYVQFSEENEEQQNNNESVNILLSNSNSTASLISNYTVAENSKPNPFLSDILKDNEKQNIKLSDIVEDKSAGMSVMEKNKEKFYNLKKEYNLLKEQFDNLKRNEELLNKRIYNEKNKKIPTEGSVKFNYKVPEKKEEKLSINKLIVFFVLSFLVGFYLIK